MPNKNLQYKKTNKRTNTKLSLGYLYGNMLIQMFQTLKNNQLLLNTHETKTVKEREILTRFVQGL